MSLGLMVDNPGRDVAESSAENSPHVGARLASLESRNESTAPVAVSNSADVQVRQPRQVRQQTGQQQRNQQAGTSRPRAPSMESDEEELKYGAHSVINLFVPISVCMAFVVITMTMNTYYKELSQNIQLVYIPFTKPTDDTAELLLQSIGNAVVVICVVAVTTTILIVLYKYGFNWIINAWLFVTTLMLLSTFLAVWVYQLLRALDMPLSLPTAGLLLFNVLILGMMSIHWHAPLLLQQGYLTVTSAVMALLFLKFLPDWTVWTLLFAISCWDLFAVLAPFGPLRILVETAQERNEPLFASLIYTSGVAYAFSMVVEVEGEVEREGDGVGGGEVLPADGGEGTTATTSVGESGGSADSSPPSTANLLKSTGQKVQRVSVPPPRADAAPASSQHSVSASASPAQMERSREAARALNGQEIRRPPAHTQPANLVHDEEHSGVKLGLGDFIFYSILVGRASVAYDWNTTLACYIAILVGLASTLMLLAVHKKALPALPISVFAGLILYFSTRGLITPFCEAIQDHQLVF